MAAEQKNGSGNTMKIIAGIAVVAVILVAAAYFGGFFGKEQPAVPIKPGQAGPSAAEKEASALLLASFDRGATLATYDIQYTDSQNNHSSSYEIATDSTGSYVGISNEAGKYESFFPANGSQGMICFTTSGQSRCTAIIKNDSTEQNANNMKAYLVSAKSYRDEKAQVQKLINAGAIRFEGNVADEPMGAFSTKKIQYSLNYGNLTVAQLASIGISPTSPELAYTDQQITYWFDKTTGLLVKGSVTYKNGAEDVSFTREFARINTGAVSLPLPPAEPGNKSGFFSFVSGVEKYYAEIASCAAKPAGAEQDTCYKSLAIDSNSYEICTRINNASEYERCAIIVAQGTLNPAICTYLPLYPDECYIAVAGESGDSNLCKNLKNASLGADCISAATAGKQKQEGLQQQDLQQHSAHNCAADADCEITGNAGQYCVPKNGNGAYLNETSPIFSCLKGIPCGCGGGFCGFAKNETYYGCVDAIEEQEFRNYIEALAHPANETGGSNGSNSTSG